MDDWLLYTLGERDYGGEGWKPSHGSFFDNMEYYLMWLLGCRSGVAKEGAQGGQAPPKCYF